LHRIIKGAQRAESRSKPSGKQIRAKIAANREKRLDIAEAMKAEAGVTEHAINTEDFSGLAYSNTGPIYSPEGFKMRELYVVAHECGHIFLYREGGPGRQLPSHVKEMEAESYAHQAFRHHGMTLPSYLSSWGRSYVGFWIAKDRDAGIPIDPRAEAYVKGLRSPYEPLRMIPLEWQRSTFAIQARLAAGTWSKALGLKPVLAEASRLVPWVLHHLCFGTTVAFFAISILQIYHPEVVIIPTQARDVTFGDLLIGYIIGLFWTNAAMMWRTLAR
jgi:hypothetical protein